MFPKVTGRVGKGEGAGKERRRAAQRGGQGGGKIEKRQMEKKKWKRKQTNWFV